MSSQKALQAVLDAAYIFFKPILQPQNAQAPGRQKISIIECLHQNIPEKTYAEAAQTYSEKSSQTVRYGLQLLETCNKTALPRTSPDALYAPRDQRIIFGLIDLVLLEGIYPNITPGILPSLDRRTKSSGYFSQLKTASEGHNKRDISLLEAIFNTLEPILMTPSNEVSDSVRERLHMDLIACLGELAFHPGSESLHWKQKFVQTLDGMPTPILLPTITPMIQRETPAWFQRELAGYLSMVPLQRQNGVKDVIMFFVSIDADVSTQRVALQQAARVIGSVPSATSPENFFAVIIPQLFELLDENGQICTAAAIVMNDILEKRKRLMEKFLVSPVLEAIRPSKKLISQGDKTDYDIVTLTSEEELERWISRLSYLVRFSPGYAISRIIGQASLPLWSLWQYALSVRSADLYCIELPKTLLLAYVKLKSGSKALTEISQNFGFDGDAQWTFSRGGMGGVKIVARDDNMKPKPLQPSDIEDQLARFMELALATSDDEFTDFFLGVCRAWLRDNSRLSERGTRDTFQFLFQLKILEAILDSHSDRLTRRPEQMIVLVKEILDDYVHQHQEERERLSSLKTPSIQNLGRISEGGQQELDGSSDLEAVTIALQLLNSIVSTSFDRAASQQERTLLSALQPSLKYLSSVTTIPASLSSLTQSLSLFISTQDGPIPSDLSSPEVDQRVLKQQQQFQKAVLYLRDEMIPIRVHGLDILQNLIAERASVIDVPAVAKLLIDMLQDKESFVYLNVVKNLTELTGKHPNTVIKMLVNVYADEAESMGIDERLKVGEALMVTVQRLGETAVGKIAEEIGNTMLGLAGRRKKRYKELEELKNEKDEEKKHLDRIGRMDEEYAKVLRVARVEAGIDDTTTKTQEEDDERWISKAGDEDYRVRTSALSVLGVLYETNARGMPAAITRSAVDMGLSILNLEKKKEQVTLRRAAVHLISNILGGLEQAGMIELLKLVPQEKLEEIVRVLGYTRATDDDGLVREQCGTLLDILTE